MPPDRYERFESLVELRDHLDSLIDDEGDLPVESFADGVRLSNVEVRVDDGTAVFH